MDWGGERAGMRGRREGDLRGSGVFVRDLEKIQIF